MLLLFLHLRGDKLAKTKPQLLAESSANLTAAMPDKRMRPIVKQEPGADGAQEPVSMFPYRSQEVGHSIDAMLTARVHGHIYGDGVYTDDSDVATAALHAGYLQPGETKLVKVYVTGPCRKFLKSFRNGIQSHRFSHFPGSFAFEAGETQREERRRRGDIVEEGAGTELEMKLVRANAEAQAFALQGMERERAMAEELKAMGEQLLQSKAQVAELRADIRIKDAALEAKDAALEAKVAVHKAEVALLESRLQSKEAALAAAPAPALAPALAPCPVARSGPGANSSALPSKVSPASTLAVSSPSRVVSSSNPTSSAPDLQSISSKVKALAAQSAANVAAKSSRPASQSASTKRSRVVSSDDD